MVGIMSSPNEGKDYTWYFSVVYTTCQQRVIICYQAHLLQEPEKSVESGDVFLDANLKGPNPPMPPPLAGADLAGFKGGECPPFLLNFITC